MLFYENKLSVLMIEHQRVCYHYNSIRYGYLFKKKYSVWLYKVALFSTQILVETFICTVLDDF